MFESKADALTEVIDGAARIALLESEGEQLRRRDTNSPHRSALPQHRLFP
jgi:hypothetical protein